ncbi:MAG: zinc ribbon domain-containing protein [Clostridia bacterium]
MEEKYCQSCGMPMGEDLYGTEKDGSKSVDYCIYCYEDGKFTYNCTMDEMIEFCIPHVLEGNDGMTEDAARIMMRSFLPNMKRWKKAES